MEKRKKARTAARQFWESLFFSLLVGGVNSNRFRAKAPIGPVIEISFQANTHRLRHPAHRYKLGFHTQEIDHEFHQYY
jgi:hypothetical protein